MVQAAVGLQRKGHQVVVYTSHHDPARCFPETKDGTLEVKVFGGFLPMSLLGRFTLVCSLIRMLWICLCLICLGLRFDVVLNDQVSAVNPLLRFVAPKVIFYCHFPDLLLCTQRASFFKRLYRWPLDWWEEWTTGICSRVLVNSEFTRGVFYKTFTSLQNVETQVLYPPIDLKQIPRKAVEHASTTEEASEGSAVNVGVRGDHWRSFEEYSSVPAFKALVDGRCPFFLSVNRYERKKNIPLAIDAFQKVCDATGSNAPPMLVIAGGYDPRVRENVEHHEELRSQAKASGLEDRVVFLRSISGTLRKSLMEATVAVLYTPANEHFGIVPCEAMALGAPVIACASGGPMETIDDEVTGILCKGDSQEDLAKEFAAGMEKILDTFTSKPAAWEALGKAGRDRVERLFSLEHFADRLDQVLT